MSEVLSPGWGEVTIETTRGGLCTADGVTLDEAGLVVTVAEAEDDGRIALWLAAGSAVLVSEAGATAKGKAEEPPAELPTPIEPEEPPLLAAADLTDRGSRGRRGKGGDA